MISCAVRTWRAVTEAVKYRSEQRQAICTVFMNEASHKSVIKWKYYYR